MTSILYSIPFYSILFYSLRSCSLYYCLLTVYKYVVKGFNNYWCVHLLNLHAHIHDFVFKSASIEHCHERIESERISCGPFDVSIYIIEHAHWSFRFVGDRPIYSIGLCIQMHVHHISFLFLKVHFFTLFNQTWVFKAQIGRIAWFVFELNMSN